MARAHGGVLAPLKERNFAYLWTGMAVSLVGDGILLVALAWQVYGLSNSPSAMAAVGIAMTVPHVAFLLVGGVASDRFDRRTVMIASDAVRGTAVGVLGVLAVTATLQLWHVFPLVAVYGAATAFFGPAFDALVPDVVSPEHLTQANAIEQFVRPAGHSLAGPALGGLLLATAGSGPASSWTRRPSRCPSPVCCGCDPGRPLPDPRSRLPVPACWPTCARASGSYAGTLAVGDLRRRHLAYLLFTGPVEVLLPYLVKNDLHAGPGTLGLLLAVGGVGGLVASLVVGWLGAPRRCMTFIYVAWTASTFVLVGYGLANAAWQAMVVSVTFNALEAAGTVVWLTTKQRFVPRALLGRISSFDWFISTGLVPLSFAVVAPLAVAIGAANTFLVAGVLGSAVTLVFLFVPGVRSVEEAEPVPAAALEPTFAG